MKKVRIIVATGAQTQEVNGWADADRQSGFAGLGDALLALHSFPRPEGVCPFCGWDSSAWRRTGLLGCGLCYSALGAGKADPTQQASQ